MPHSKQKETPVNLRSFPLRNALLPAVLALAACQQPQAPADEGAPDAKPGITVSDGMLMLPVVKGNPGGVYFAVANGGARPATLAAVTIEGADKAEMHETKGGSMELLPPLEIKPGETVKFERGGKHVMAFGLGEAVQAGTTTEMTLTFADGDKVSAPLRVEAMGAAMPDMAGMDHGDQP